MIGNFRTSKRPQADAALCVYALYQSRDLRYFKVSKQMWSQIERFVKGAAKRARNLSEFIERLKPRLCAGALRPEVAGGVLTCIGSPEIEQKEALEAAYKQTSIIIALVRERIERERPLRKAKAMDKEQEAES